LTGVFAKLLQPGAIGFVAFQGHLSSGPLGVGLFAATTLAHYLFAHQRFHRKYRLMVWAVGGNQAILGCGAAQPL
jgi:hypothetical protein